MVWRQHATSHLAKARVDALSAFLSSSPVPNIQNFCEPTKELDAAMQTRRITHDGNSVLE
jgi:hypothetical protein